VQGKRFAQATFPSRLRAHFVTSSALAESNFPIGGIALGIVDAAIQSGKEATGHGEQRG
jgi:hypothetical protein